MKRILAAFLFLPLSISLAPTTAFAAKAGSKTKAAGPDFKAMMKELLALWGTLDPDKAAPKYSSEPGILFFDVAPMKYTGWKEYAEGTKKVFRDFGTLTLTLGDDAKVEQHGDVAWGMATVHIDLTMKDGTKDPLDARWTVIWEKQGGKWLVVHEHTSAPLPPPPPPAPKPASTN